MSAAVSLIKTPKSLAAMRVAAQAAVQTLDYIATHIRPGVTTERLNSLCHDYMVNVLRVQPASLGYKGFPKSICASVNNEVCHGIPSDKTRLAKGDIVNVDVAVIKDGYFGDSSRTFCVGKVSGFALRLTEVARQSLYQGILATRAGKHLGDIGFAIQNLAESEGFSVVRDYCGHGLGKEFHCAPQVLHYGNPGEGMLLEEGMCFTIEPMINAGAPETRVLADGWTVVTRDRKLSAQWEHTVLVTSDGCEVLTLAASDTLSLS